MSKTIHVSGLWYLNQVIDVAWGKILSVSSCSAVHILSKHGDLASEQLKLYKNHTQNVCASKAGCHF